MPTQIIHSVIQIFMYLSIIMTSFIWLYLYRKLFERISILEGWKKDYEQGLR